jgi:hypothetical protein
VKVTPGGGLCVWVSFLCIPQGITVEGLVPSVEMLRGSGTFKRRGLVRPAPGRY